VRHEEAEDAPALINADDNADDDDVGEVQL